MARHHDVWALTYEGFRPAIERELKLRPGPGLQFVYFRLPFERRRYVAGEAGRTGLPEQVHYHLWQLAATRAARQLHRAIKFHLAHHVTIVKYWAPSAMAGLPVPFIWGPVGGGESAPRSFYRSLGVRGHLYERTRDLARWLMYFEPNVRRAARRSALAFAATAETGIRMTRLGAQRVEVRCQNALTTADWSELGDVPVMPDTPLRFLSLGRLLAFKGFHFSITAYANAVNRAGFRSPMATSEYWIVGDGPERPRLEALIARLGMSQRVKLLERVPRREAFSMLKQCHVFVHPSLHESSSTALLEAMAAARAVVCLRLGGAMTVAGPDTAALVSAVHPKQLVADLASAMASLAEQPERRRIIGEAARQHIRAGFLWGARVEELAERYRTIAVL